MRAGRDLRRERFAAIWPSALTDLACPMMYALIRDGQIVEVLSFVPCAAPGETVMPMREAIALGIPYA